MYNVLPTETDLTPSNEPFTVWDLNDFLDYLASGDNPSRTVKDLDLNYLPEFNYVPSIDETVFLAISLARSLMTLASRHTLPVVARHVLFSRKMRSVTFSFLARSFPGKVSRFFLLVSSFRTRKKQKDEFKER